MSVQLYLFNRRENVKIDELEFVTWQNCNWGGGWSTCRFENEPIAREIRCDGTVHYTADRPTSLLVRQIDIERTRVADLAAKLKAAEEYIAKLECMPCDQTWKECKEAVEQEIKVINFNS